MLAADWPSVVFAESGPGPARHQSVGQCELNHSSGKWPEVILMTSSEGRLRVPCVRLARQCVMSPVRPGDALSSAWGRMSSAWGRIVPSCVV